MTVFNKYLFSCSRGWGVANAPTEAVSPPQTILGKLRNQRVHGSSLSAVPNIHPNTAKAVSTNKTGDSLKFPVDSYKGGVNWTFAERILPEGMRNKQAPAAMPCFSKMNSRLFHKHRCENEAREGEGEKMMQREGTITRAG